MIALSRAFKVALIISVASMAFSFGDNCKKSTFPPDIHVVCCEPFNPARGAFLVFVCVIANGFAAVLESFVEVVFVIGELCCNRSLSIVTVAGVHVDVEVTAALIDSTFSFKEVMLKIDYSKEP